MSDPPERPSDERDGEPYYITNECAHCGAALELADPDSGWNDEWVCVDGCEGIHMDWPDSEYNKLAGRAAAIEQKD